MVPTMMAPVRLRRARRTDFVRVMELLAASGQAVPLPERATLRRFRHLVADLGSDLYVALLGERAVGVVHVTYARQLATAAVGRIETLAVAPDTDVPAATAALLDCAVARAQRRGCARLWLASGAAPGGSRAANGWQSVAGTFVLDLAVEPSGATPPTPTP